MQQEATRRVPQGPEDGVIAHNAHRAHESSTSVHEVTIPSRGALLSVRDHAGTGLPILLLPGGLGWPGDLEAVAGMLSPPHRVITFDQRGVGASKMLDGSYQLEDYLADYEAIRAHFGSERIQLFGFSAGGALAQLYAVTYPEHVANLVLCSSALGVGEDWTQTLRDGVRRVWRQSGWPAVARLAWWQVMARLAVPRRLGDWGVRHLLQHLWPHYFADPRRAPPVDPRRLRGCNSRALRESTRALVSAEAAVLSQADMSLRCPVLIVYGDDDLFGADVQRVYARFPSAERVMLAHSSHVPWLQNPDDLRRVLRAFYERFEVDGP